MKIIKTTLEDNILTVELDKSIAVEKVYLDNVLNSKNRFSLEDNKHSHIIDNPSINGNKITINVKEFQETAFIVTIVSNFQTASAIAIDYLELYNSKVKLLTFHCSTCLDKHNKENIIICDFKNQLLDYAVENNLTDDAIQHYIDLSRMLTIPSEHICSINTVRNNCKTCTKCCNGCCSL